MFLEIIIWKKLVCNVVKCVQDAKCGRRFQKSRKYMITILLLVLSSKGEEYVMYHDVIIIKLRNNGKKIMVHT